MPPSTLPLAPFSTEGQNLIDVLEEQGRTFEWLRQRPYLVPGRPNGISRTYMYRLRLHPLHPDANPPPPGFWRNVARELGVPLRRLTTRQE